MKIRNCIVLTTLGIAPLIGISTVRAAGTTRPDDAVNAQTLQKMQEQMNQMQVQLQQTQDQLKKTQSQLQQSELDAATRPSAADTSAAVRAVINDVDAHSTQSLTMTAGSAGLDTMKGFYIQTDDGQSYFHPGILFDGQSGFFLHPPYHWNSTGIVQANLDGSVFSKDLTYAFAFNNGVGPLIEYAEFSYVFAHGFLDHNLALTLGRIKNPVWKETSDIADPNRLFVADSLAGDLIGGNAFGPQEDGFEFSLIGDDAPLHIETAVTNGPINPADSFGDTTGANNIEWSNRVDYKFFGDWIDATDLTGKLSGQKNLLDIGGGADYLNAFNLSWLRLDVDAQWQVAQSITAYGALYYNNIGFSHQAVPTIGARNDYGGVIEGGYMITPAIQALARYSLVRTDTHLPGLGAQGTRVFHEIGLGGTYYFGPDGSWGNHMKMTMDIDYLPRGTPADSTLLYTLSPNHKQEWDIRMEFQFWI